VTDPTLARPACHHQRFRRRFSAGGRRGVISGGRSHAPAWPASVWVPPALLWCMICACGYGYVWLCASGGVLALAHSLEMGVLGLAFGSRMGKCTGSSDLQRRVRATCHFCCSVLSLHVWGLSFGSQQGPCLNFRGLHTVCAPVARQVGTFFPPILMGFASIIGNIS
jgi:hypothetical protein